MRAGPFAYSADPTAGPTSESGLLRRLGSELALVYHDTLQAPLPPAMQRLIDRLEQESRADLPKQADDGHEG